MPAVTPADVHTLPSRTKIGSASTRDRGVALGELRGSGPVGGGAAAVEQAGLGEQEGAGAHRGDPPGGAGDPGDVADGGDVVEQVVHPVAAGHHEGVDGSVDVGQRGVGDDRQPARRPDRPAGRSGGLDRVAGPGPVVATAGAVLHVAVGPGEDLQRPGQIEALHALEDDDHDPAAARCIGHGAIIVADGGGSNDELPTFSARCRKEAVPTGASSRDPATLIG